MFRIVFFGLIAHFALETADFPSLHHNVERAVLVAAPQHEPMLAVSETDLADGVDPTAFDRNARKVRVDSVSWWVFDIARRHLVIHGLPPGLPTRPADVPHLTNITDGNLPLPNIVDTTYDYRIRGLVDYTGGSLSNECPITGVAWTKSSSHMPGCHPPVVDNAKLDTIAAPLVVYTADVNSPSIASGMRRLQLQKYATIMILNSPTQMEGMGHYIEYHWTMANSNCMATINHEKATSTCSVDNNNDAKTIAALLAALQTGTASTSDATVNSEARRSVNNPECTNSQYP